ncbi:MAG: Lrp/AsnC family transcriptional regulator [Rhodospirillales bacterium]|nr:Lrp/AsnC family transcriptional regulator [Rhodospirillales bacterium]MBN8901800.1 Lrp/AsnC family transcriptional regulator [Rhodospirillales bacterium]
MVGMLDSFDRRILGLLQEDADLPLQEIADRIGLSASACSRRIMRLRQEGTIARRVAVLDRKRMNLPTTVFVVIRTTRHAADWLEEFRQALAAIPEIVEVHRLTGNFDYILKLVLPNVEHYDTIYKALVRRIELSDVSAYISMETLKDETALPTGYAAAP